MSDLSKKHGEACRGGVPPLEPSRQEELLRQLEQGWELVEHHHLVRTFRFADFPAAMRGVAALAEVAEAENHHPRIEIDYDRVKLEIWTHKIDGLTESDFVLAAKAERVMGGKAAA